MMLGTSIANIWARPPQTAHAARHCSPRRFPAASCSGSGVGYPQQAASVNRDFGQPVATLRAYSTR
jgi:hypothetical protein